MALLNYKEYTETIITLKKKKIKFRTPWCIYLFVCMVADPIINIGV